MSWASISALMRLQISGLLEEAHCVVDKGAGLGNLATLTTS